MVLICSLPVTQASYVSDGSLIILRSQFVDSESNISMNAVLDEDLWDKAGSLTVAFTQPDNITITVYFANSVNWLYFAVVATEFVDNDHDFFLLTFDTEADGSLDTPEDAVAGVGSSVSDYYFNGESWVPDSSSSTSDFSGGLRRASGSKIMEFRKALVPEDIIYDGFRVANPSNTFTSFSFQYTETRRINESLVEPITFNFPSTPTNATGYVDLKLAGAEDQDLPEFIPPETFTETQTETQSTVYDGVEDLGSAALSIDAFFVLAIVIIPLIRRRRR